MKLQMKFLKFSWVFFLPSIATSAIINDDIESYHLIKDVAKLDNCDLVTVECDKFIKSLLGPERAFNDLPSKLQSEVIAFHKIFEIETKVFKSYRFDSKFFFRVFCFTIPFGMSQNVTGEAEKKTIKALKERGIYCRFKGNLSLTYEMIILPELFLEVIKTELEEKQQAYLIDCALSTPLFYEKFFEYLSTDLLNVSRDDLTDAIVTKYSKYFQSDAATAVFKSYQNLNRAVWLYLSTENALIISAMIWAPLLYLLATNELLLLCPLLLPLLLLAFKYLDQLYFVNYERFTEISGFQFRRYFALNCIVGLITFVLLKIDVMIYEFMEESIPLRKKSNLKDLLILD